LAVDRHLEVVGPEPEQRLAVGRHGAHVDEQPGDLDRALETLVLGGERGDESDCEREG
jgi:hypothetical protein